MLLSTFSLIFKGGKRGEDVTFKGVVDVMLLQMCIIICILTIRHYKITVLYAVPEDELHKYISVYGLRTHGEIGGRPVSGSL